MEINELAHVIPVRSELFLTHKKNSVNTNTVLYVLV